MAVDALARALAAGKVPVTAYEMAVKAGYTGTEEQFERDMGNSGTNAANAAASASAAAASAESVSASAAQIATNTSDISDLKESISDGFVYKVKNMYGFIELSNIGFLRPNGTDSSNSLYRHTDYMYIDGAKTLIITGRFSTSESPAVFYDENKTYISGYKAEGGAAAAVEYIIPVPSNAKYVISSCARDYRNVFTIDCVFKNPVKLSDICYISPNGNDENNGLTSATPIKSCYRALQILASNGMLIMMEGDYDGEQFAINFDTFKNVLGINKPRIICYQQKITEAELVSGYTKVYGITKSFSSTIPVYMSLWQHDIPDASTAIPPTEAHPLNRNRKYRLPSTRIQHAESIAEIESADTPMWYADGSTLYFSVVSGSDLASNPIIVPRLNMMNPYNRYRASSDKNTDLSIKNIAILYNGFDANRACGMLDNVEIGMCTGNGVVTADYCESLLLRNCNFYAVTNGNTGDGVNVHNYSENNVTKRSFVTLENCWLHDCSDDGESCHENANTTHYGCLVEYNGCGITPAGGNTECNNVISRHNGPHSWVGETSSCPGFFCLGDDTALTCIGCVSYDNQQGFSCYSATENPHNCLTIINCTSRNNTEAEIYASRGNVVTDNVKVVNPIGTKHFSTQNGGVIVHKSIDSGVDSDGIYIITENGKSYIVNN